MYVVRKDITLVRGRQCSKMSNNHNTRTRMNNNCRETNNILRQKLSWTTVLHKSQSKC